MIPSSRSDRAAAAALDEIDPLRDRRGDFVLPPGVIYLDGNSLGVLPRAVPARIEAVLKDQWGQGLVRSWNSAGWIDLPARVGARIARLIGARPDEVIAADSTSLNVFKLLAAALEIQPRRRTILSEEGNFPTDLYMAQGLCGLTGRAELKLVRADADPHAIVDAINEDVAVVMLTEVDFRTGRRHDMQAVTARAHARGALVLWDLAHSAGAFPVHLNEAGADFAVGCGYKYLNGGPGAPAFLYVRQDLQARAEQPLSGWMGHARPFDFVHQYEPAAGIARHRAAHPRSCRSRRSTRRSTPLTALTWPRCGKSRSRSWRPSSRGWRPRRRRSASCWPARAKRIAAAARSPIATRPATRSCRRSSQGA
jgi:kynureninase